jgi:hypothetical protein
MEKIHGASRAFSLGLLVPPPGNFVGLAQWMTNGIHAPSPYRGQAARRNQDFQSCLPSFQKPAPPARPANITYPGLRSPKII